MVKVLVPSGVLGLQFDQDALREGLERRPDLIAIDGGSTDSGPYYLGTGTSKYASATTQNELRILIEAQNRAKVPLIITSAGTCGTNRSVDWLVGIANEIAHSLKINLKIATIKSSQEPETIKRAWLDKKLLALQYAPSISAEIIENCQNIVALMGVEQIQAALNTGADIVIAGRATDTASIAALPLLHSTQAGIAWHGAKIAECGALCSTHPMSGCILVEFFDTYCEVEPLHPDAQCTPYSVSSHMLYENANPFKLIEPGGYLDVTEAQYEAVSPKRVRVSGSKWIQAKQYSVKLEGVGISGYQTTTLTLLRNQHYIKNAATWVNNLKSYLLETIEQSFELNPKQFSLDFRLIGSNSTLGKLETKNTNPAEIGVLCIVTADTQDIANEIAKHANPYFLHYPLSADEELPTFSFPYSPAETPRGPLYEFYLNHALVVSDPMEPFQLEVIEVNGTTR